MCSHVLMGQTFIQVGNLHNIKKLLAAEGTLVRGEQHASSSPAASAPPVLQMLQVHLYHLDSN